MKSKTPRDLKINFAEPEGGYDQKGLSTAPSRAISEIGGIDSVSHQNPKYNESIHGTSSANQHNPLDSNLQPDDLRFSTNSRDTSAFLTNEEVQKFQEFYKSRFGKVISYEEAYEKGMKLVRIIELVYKPMSQEEYQALQKRRKSTERYPSRHAG
jgi:hypothetical protein